MDVAELEKRFEEQTLYIVKWRALYECNDSGNAWKAGDKFRMSALNFLRLQCHGRSRSASYSALTDFAPAEKIAPTLGVFDKLLQVAGDNPPPLRGYIVDSHGEALTHVQLARMFKFSQKHVIDAIEILTHEEVNWLGWFDSARISGNSRKSGDSLLNSKAKQREAKEKLKSAEADQQRKRTRGGARERGGELVPVGNIVQVSIAGIDTSTADDEGVTSSPSYTERLIEAAESSAIGRYRRLIEQYERTPSGRRNLDDLIDRLTKQRDNPDGVLARGEDLIRNPPGFVVHQLKTNFEQSEVA